MSVTALSVARSHRAPDAAELLDTVFLRLAGTVERHAEGPLSTMAVEQLVVRGKQLRSQLLFSAARGFGISPTRTIPVAVACELLHNATLIHDDLQDGDKVRRGQPALWVRHGAGQAINAGDLLLMLPVAAIEDSDYPPALCWQLSRALTRRAALTACGQADEMAARAEWDCRFSRYCDAAIGKTGHFFALPVESAALLAGLSPSTARDLGEILLPLGLIFQIRDDIVDLFGDKGRGEAGCDVREGKISSLVALLLERDPSARHWLLPVLAAPRARTSHADIDRFARAVVHSGALDAARAAMSSAAQQILDNPRLRAFPALLGEVAGWIERLSVGAAGETP